MNNIKSSLPAAAATHSCINDQLESNAMSPTQGSGASKPIDVRFDGLPKNTSKAFAQRIRNLLPSHKTREQVDIAQTTQATDSAASSQSSSHTGTNKATRILNVLLPKQSPKALEASIPQPNIFSSSQIKASDISGTPVQTIKTPLRDKALKTLANIPLVKNSSTVSQYAKNIRLKNAELLNQFISSFSLSEKFNQQKLLSAIEDLHIPAGHQLTGRDFDLLMDKISKFDGIGEAKTLPRKLQINIWPYEFMDHPGHASMTVQHASLENKNGNLNHDPTTYISWWPEEEVSGLADRFKKFNAAPIDSRGNGGSYRLDESKELSTRSEKKLNDFNNVRETLKQGGIKKKLKDSLNLTIKNMLSIYQEETHENHLIGKSSSEIHEQLFNSLTEIKSPRKPPTNIVVIENKNFIKNNIDTVADIFLEEVSHMPEIMEKELSEEEQEIILTHIENRVLSNTDIQDSMDKTVQSILKQAPYFQPRARQEIDRGNWFISAKKIFLPLKGAQDEEAFSFFGLNEPAINQEWERVQQSLKNNEMGYRFISKNQNCAGIIVNALLAGGAEEYLPFNASLLAETPNDVQKYSQGLQVRIDELNEKNKNIKAFYRHEQQKRDIDEINNRVSNASTTTISDGFNEAIKAMPSNQRKRFSELQKVMNKIPNEGIDNKNLTSYGIALVDALSKLLADSTLSSSTSAAQALFYAAAMQLSLENRMQAHLEGTYYHKNGI